jgi:hypothetical protein
MSPPKHNRCISRSLYFHVGGHSNCTGRYLTTFSPWPLEFSFFASFSPLTFSFFHAGVGVGRREGYWEGPTENFLQGLNYLSPVFLTCLSFLRRLHFLYIFKPSNISFQIAFCVNAIC